jgi:RecA/RadA recombinase
VSNEQKDRLPTITAAQAFDDLGSTTSKLLPTGLDTLDKLLVGSGSEADEKPSVGGVRKGQVTEVWGPSGSGKTALG